MDFNLVVSTLTVKLPNFNSPSNFPAIWYHPCYNTKILKRIPLTEIDRSCCAGVNSLSWHQSNPACHQMWFKTRKNCKCTRSGDYIRMVCVVKWHSRSGFPHFCLWYSIATNWKASFYKSDGFNPSGMEWKASDKAAQGRSSRVSHREVGGTGISPRNYDDIIGSTATVGYTTQ